MARGVRASPWLLGTVARRLRSEWRLLVSVAAVATLACTLITSLGLLVTATEQGGVRGALAGIQPSQSVIDVRVYYPNGSLAQLRTNMDTGVAHVLDDAGTAEGIGVAASDFIPIEELGESVIAYVGENDGIEQNATLTSGTWGDAAAKTVAVPATAASHFGLSLGSELAVGDAVVTVAGVFEPNDPDERFWDLDPLGGKGSIPGYINPRASAYQQFDAFGPIIAAPAGMDAAGIPAYFADVSYAPTFTSAAVDDLEPLIERLEDADLTVAVSLGNAGARLYVLTDVAEAVSAVVAGLVVTRSTVVVVSLLLLVLAVAAMAQTARLFTEARTGERQLMRARGAGDGHLLALAAVEAVAIGLVTAVASPLLALLVYRAFAAQPAMVSAGMPATAGLNPQSAITAAAVAAVLVVVLLIPTVRAQRGGGLTRSTRQRRGAGLIRGGLDIGLAVRAAVAFWQLQSYKSVVDDTASLSIDPVLVAGPALLLLAGSLLATRLVAPAARLVERIGARSRSAVVALASWDLGRRYQRATSAVLLLALALAVGSFSLSFLATWKQSQLDQASLAVGAPVRSGEEVGSNNAVLRTSGRLSPNAGMGQEDMSGQPVQVLGLTEGARELLGRGRVGEEGGERVRSLLSNSAGSTMGADIPSGAKTLSLDVTIDEIEGLRSSVLAVIESNTGGLSMVSLGSVAVDGTTAQVSGELAPNSARLVGLQFGFTAPGTGSEGGTSVETFVEILVSGISADSTALDVPTDGWFSIAADGSGKDPILDGVPAGSQFRVGVVVPGAVAEQPISYSVVGWRPVASVPIVVPTEFAERLYITSGTPMSLGTLGVQIPVTVDGAVDLIPGAASAAELRASSSGLSASSARAGTVVLDGELLARALIGAGVTEPLANEWWLESDPGGLKDSVSAAGVGEGLQAAPLRVATQVALWLAIIAGAVLAAVGFGVHTASTQRARRIELAQLRAIGLPRSGVLRLVAVESLMLSVLGTVFGVAIGLLLASLVGPLVAVSPSGEPPVPAVIVIVPWTSIGLLCLEVVAVLALIVLVVARVQRTTQPADLLREGGGE